jgi:diaminopimelate epimerase
MSNGEFHKMHGLGNDFVIIDGRHAPVEITNARAKAIADRRTGIGCDQMILLENSDVADLRMRIYNADGGEVESCGNATRCVVALIGKDITIDTAGGLLSGKLKGSAVTIDMGSPRFEWQDIPLAFAMDSAAMPMAWDELSSPMAVNVGNPHVVFFVGDLNAVNLEQLGPCIENDSAFPERVNVNVATIADNKIRLRGWDMGGGQPRVGGTCASPTAVAAIRQRLVSSPVEVQLKGGTLTIAWELGGSIIMTGGASHVFTGQANWDDFG